jgi:hypothetical protein
MASVLLSRYGRHETRTTSGAMRGLRHDSATTLHPPAGPKYRNAAFFTGSECRLSSAGEGWLS